MDLRLFIYPPDKLLTSSMLPKGTRKKAFKLSSLEEKSMELVQVEIGLPKDPTY